RRCRPPRSGCGWSGRRTPGCRSAGWATPRGGRPRRRAGGARWPSWPRRPGPGRGGRRAGCAGWGRRTRAGGATRGRAGWGGAGGGGGEGEGGGRDGGAAAVDAVGARRGPRCAAGDEVEAAAVGRAELLGAAARRGLGVGALPAPGDRRVGAGRVRRPALVGL